jgi:hypothetical protein
VLIAEGITHHIVGDANGGFTLQQAIHEAAHVARAI